MRLLVAALVVASAAPTLAASPQSAVTRWRGGDWTVWRIDRLSTHRRLTEYADIRLRAGDVVTFDAGGCVSRALVWLPGTPAPVPLAGALRRPTMVPESAGAEAHALRLGICFSVPGYFENPLCSTQHPGIDKPTGLRRLICSIGATNPSGRPGPGAGRA